MSNLQKKEALDSLISIKVTSTMKEQLADMAAKDYREFSDFIRLEWTKLLRGNGKKIKKDVN